MQYMVIEHFKPGKQQMIYERVERDGRLLSDDIRFINSWVASDLSICYQLMETENRDALETWMSKWSDLVNFEVIPVINSTEAKRQALKNSMSDE